jgi:hypothetical protein
VAATGEKWLLVVDGRESKPYDLIVPQSVAFDSPSMLHYVAVTSEPGSSRSNVYLIQSRTE